MRFIPPLLVVGVCYAAFACSSSNDAPAPSTVHIFVDRPYAQRAQTVVTDALRPLNVSVALAVDEKSADVALSSDKGGDKSSFIQRYWVPVVQLPSPATSITSDQLRDALSGRTTTWADIDGESTPLRVVASSDPAPAFDLWWPDETPAVETLSLDQIDVALFVDPGTLALVPLDDVNAGMRSLDVDGVNAVFGSGDLASYPLVEMRSIKKRHTDNDKFAQAIDAAAAALQHDLAALVPEPIIMRATGDIIPARCALAKIQSYGDYKHPFLELGDWLRTADITVGSLDSSLADISPPWPCEDTFNLAAPSAAIEGLTYSGFDLLTNAANHALDCGQIGSCGPDAMFATNENLRAKGIQVVGSGADLADARKPVILTVRGVRFAFLGYDDIAAYYHAEPSVPGTAPLDEAYVREDVAAAKAQADIVIVMPHWGIEYQAEPTERQSEIAQAAVDAGADVILGNHPHWVEAVEMIGDSFVEYALGNFVFDQDWSLETQQGAVIELAFHPDGQRGAQLRGVRYRPVHIYDEQQPRFAEDGEADQIMKRIWDASATLTVSP